MAVNHKFKHYKFVVCCKGVAALELALLMPLLFLVAAGVFQVTEYLRAAQKVNIVAKDLAHLIATEDCIASDVSPLDKNFAGFCTGIGGRTELETIFNNVIPFLMYPYGFNPNGDASQIEARLAAIPGIGICPSSGYKLVWAWQNRYPENSNTSVTQNNFAEDSRTISAYSNQPFIAVNFVFHYRSVLGNGITSFLFPSTIERIGTFPVHSAWVDGACGNPRDQVLQPGEFISNMMYCTDCNIISNHNL